MPNSQKAYGNSVYNKINSPLVVRECEYVQMSNIPTQKKVEAMVRHRMLCPEQLPNFKSLTT